MVSTKTHPISSLLFAARLDPHSGQILETKVLHTSLPPTSVLNTSYAIVDLVLADAGSPQALSTATESRSRAVFLIVASCGVGDLVVRVTQHEAGRLAASCGRS